MQALHQHENGSVSCRSDLDKPDASQAEEKDDDFVKAFKVANFEIMTSPDKGMGVTS